MSAKESEQQQKKDEDNKNKMEKQQQDDPRKPTYLLVQKPNDQNSLPTIFAACGGKSHPPQSPSDSII